MYIFIERERERGVLVYVYRHIYIYICKYCVYIRYDSVYISVQILIVYMVLGLLILLCSVGEVCAVYVYIHTYIYCSCIQM